MTLALTSEHEQLAESVRGWAAAQQPSDGAKGSGRRP